MPNKGRIIYACPDNPNPSGGVRRLYRHVEILSRNGVEAYVMHQSRAFAINWFETDAKTIYLDDRPEFLPADTIVIPEVMTRLMIDLRASVAKRIVYALNWANIFKYMPIGLNWPKLGIKEALAGSQYERHFIMESMGIDAPVIASGTDSTLFSPSQEKHLQIAYMPRKEWLAPAILGTFRSMCPEHCMVPFIEIGNASHKEVAKCLTKAAIFLSATFPEGLARPPLEAMSSGCIVVGFNGRGAAEYMKDGYNCYVAEDGDILGAVHGLKRAVEEIQTGAAQSMAAAARATALRYDLATEEKRVLSYWENRRSFEG